MMLDAILVLDSEGFSFFVIPRRTPTGLLTI